MTCSDGFYIFLPNALWYDSPCSEPKGSHSSPCRRQSSKKTPDNVIPGPHHETTKVASQPRRASEPHRQTHRHTKRRGEKEREEVLTNASSMLRFRFTTLPMHKGAHSTLGRRKTLTPGPRHETTKVATRPSTSDRNLISESFNSSS